MYKLLRISTVISVNGRPESLSQKIIAVIQSIIMPMIIILLFMGFLINAPCHAASNPPQLVVGSEIDFPPYAVIDANGRASGFSVELLEAVAEAMGLSVKVNTGPWPEVLASFKAGKYDLLPLVALSPQRADMATYTKPHTIAYDCFFVRRGSRPISSLAEAKGKEVIVMSSDAAHEKLAASGVQARMIETKTIPEAMRLLASGRHDAVLVPKLLGLIVLREAKLEEVIEAGNPIADYNRQFAFAVKRGNTELSDKLEQGLAILRATGRYDAIYRKWFGRIEPQKRRLRTIIVNNYHPYTYMNEKGEADGFSVEIARAVAKTMDLELEIRADKWDQSMKELETGGIDLIPMMAYSPERAELFDFSVPYTIAYDTIFFKKGVPGIRSLKDLNGKTVIVTNNDAAHGYLLSSGLSKTMSISLANSLPDALTQLAAGKGDAAIMPKLVGLVVAKNLNLKEIDVSPEIIAGYSRAWCFAVRNGDQAMLDRLNQGLNIIKATGEYDAIHKKWFATMEGTKLQWETILKYGSMVVLILLASIVWNVMLNLKVKTKTRHLEAEIAERKKAEENIGKMQNILSEGQKIANMGIFEYDAENKTTVWSEEEYRIYGQDPAGPSPAYKDMLAKSIHPEDADMLHQVFTNAMRNKSVYELEHRIVRPDGSVRWVYDRAHPYFDNDGRLLRYIGATLDITERKRAEEALNTFKESVENASDAIGMATPEGLHYYQNRAFDQLFGKIIVGETPISAAYVNEEAGKEVFDAIMSGGQWAGEVKMYAKDRSIRDIYLRAYANRDKYGKITSLVGIHTDITERKHHEEEHLTMERQLLHSQKLESLGVLAGGIAHDFNNLLMTILGNLELAMDDISPLSPARPYLENAHSASKRAADLTRQMLAYSGKGKFVIENMNLSELVQENIHLWRSSIPTTIHLNIQLNRDIRLIMADAGQIQQVVMNLISNAAEAIGDRPGTITITTGTQSCDESCLKASRLHEKPEPGEFVYLEVADTGCGMDEATQAKIFDPFFTTKFTGRGLGMSAMQGIIVGHKGAIFLNSEIGNGTIIRVIFPVSDADAAINKSVAPEQAASLVADASSRPGKILIVDDEGEVRNLCSNMLARLGYKTLTAADGEEAVEVFRDHADDIACIILDMTMPKMDGYATFESLKQIRSDVKAILSSGYSQDAITQRFAGLGLAGFIQKPYRRQQLQDELERVIKGGKL